MNKTIKRLELAPAGFSPQQLRDAAWRIFQYQYFRGIIIWASAQDIPVYGTALGLMLKNFHRPVVFFSREGQSQEAARWAALGIGGIFALGDDGFDLACRTTCGEDGRLTSPDYPPVGRKDGAAQEIFSWLLPPEEQDPFLMCDSLNERVWECTVEELLAARPDWNRIDGILLVLRSEGEFLRLLGDAFPLLTQLRRKKLPMVVTGGPKTVAEPSLRRRLLAAGLISAGDMTREAARVKLMWTLARTGSPEGVRLYFSLSFAGEVTQAAKLPL